jgi:hypothetical protein
VLTEGEMLERLPELTARRMAGVGIEDDRSPVGHDGRRS